MKETNDIDIDIKCYFCKNSFQRKYTLDRHLKENRCESFKKMNALDIHNMLRNNNVNSNINVYNEKCTINNINNIHIERIEIINPINNLDTKYIEPSKMKEFVDEYNYPKLNLLLGNYIKDIICNKNQPQNHSVKYVKRNHLHIIH